MSYSQLPPYTDDGSTSHVDGQEFSKNSKLDDKTQTSLPACAQDVRSKLPSNLTYSRDSKSNIICTDQKLEDLACFSAFIQHHGAKPPELKVVISGTHWEDLSEAPDRTDGNHVKKDSQRLVKDFELYIPLTAEILIRRNGNAPPYFFTFNPDIKTYRNSTLKRRQDPIEDQERIDNGLSIGQHAIVQYLSSTHPLKEFRFEKVVSGWDIKTLRTQLSGEIKRQTGYTGTINVTLQQRESFIYVRPGTTFSNLYRHPFTFFLRCVLFPIGFILLLLDYVYLGRYWHVLGAKYDLHFLNPSTGEERGMSLQEFVRHFEEQIVQSVKAGRIEETLEWESSQSGSST